MRFKRANNTNRWRCLLPMALVAVMLGLVSMASADADEAPFARQFTYLSALNSPESGLNDASHEQEYSYRKMVFDAETPENPFQHDLNTVIGHLVLILDEPNTQTIRRNRLNKNQTLLLIQNQWVIIHYCRIWQPCSTFAFLRISIPEPVYFHRPPIFNRGTSTST